MIHRVRIGRLGRMARSFNGSSQQTGKESAIVSGVPLSVFLWFMSYSAAAQQFGACVTNYGGGATGDYHALIIDGSQGGDPVRAMSYEGGVGASAADTTTGYTVGRWHSACGVWAANDDRRAYIDAGSEGTEGTTRTPGSLSRTCIGDLWRSDNPGKWFDGMVCDVAWWAAALEIGEITDLHRGKIPLAVRPGYLLAWHRMTSPSFGDLDWSRQGFDMEPTGSPAWGGGPPPHFGTQDCGHLMLEEYLTVAKVGKVVFYGTDLGSGVTDVTYGGTMVDANGNLRVSGQVYEGAAS